MLLTIVTFGCTKTQENGIASEAGTTRTTNAEGPELPAEMLVDKLSDTEPRQRHPNYDFEVGRRFSTRQSYASVLTSALPIEQSASQGARAYVVTKLRAREKDLFFDDYYYRLGAMVLLGLERGEIVALSTRYYTDIAFPSPKLLRDGVGTVELGTQWLIVFDEFSAPNCVFRRPRSSRRTRSLRGGRSVVCKSSRFVLKRRRREGRSANAVRYEPLGSHDLALLYFPSSAPIVGGLPTLGLEAPTETVRKMIADKSNVLGLEMLLISPKALTAVRNGLKVESTAGGLIQVAVSAALAPVLSGLAPTASAVPKWLNELIGGVVSDEASARIASLAQQLGNRVEAGKGGQVPPRARMKARRWQDPRRFEHASLSTTDSGEILVESKTLSTTYNLAGVDQSGSNFAEQREYLKNAFHLTTVVVVDAHKPGAGALVFLPEENVVVNLELLGHGLARLRTEAGKPLPEFGAAAQRALANGTGFAASWSDDRDYVNTVRAANLPSSVAAR